MQTQAFIAQSPATSETVGVEISLKLYTYPKPDREPVKILVIGSKEAINSIIHTLHYHRFAEVFEWTDYLPAPTPERPLQTRPGEVMKALVKYCRG
ncbi:hypothetical protein [Pseudanabaena sp. FACHB-2040]|uniref:hypothetical protein n=1 Tax=Pseudanabaena sp. FACHB-2040 TaxID=2692859 RepID=UPI00168610B6|nr:hypothetical protein [Pseudanabaena sp. FACHB-2040]MBD2257820.1 hypothetical protein [Pseudanabaena sp. FACHB-2040]